MPLTAEELSRLVLTEKGSMPEVAAMLRNMLLGVYPARPVWEDLANDAYTLQPSDHGKIRATTYSSGGTVVVPAGLPADFWCSIFQDGTGQVTFDVSAVTCPEADSQFKTEKQYVMVTLIAKSTDVYRLVGRTAA